MNANIVKKMLDMVDPRVWNDSTQTVLLGFAEDQVKRILPENLECTVIYIPI
jgi:hypothetical protein